VEILADLNEAIRASQNLTDLIDEAAAEVSGLNRTDLRCVDVIERRGRISAGDLARESGLTTGAVTAVLDRLERSGHARRIRDTDDRRRVLVELTPKARREAEKVYGPIGETFLRMTEDYSTEDLELVLEFLQRGREVTAGHLERIRAMAAKR
jgi:DNA-binding MarR family transcriptional regulator